MADTLAHMKVSITVTQLTFQPLFWHFKSGRWEDDQIKWSIIQPLLLASGGPVSVVGVVISHQVKLEARSGVRKKAIGGEMKLLHRLVTNSLDDTVIFFPDMDTNSQVWAQCHGSKTESATPPSLSWSMSDPGSGGEASSPKVRRERARRRRGPRLWVQSRVGELRTEAVTDTRHEARSRSPCSVIVETRSPPISAHPDYLGFHKDISLLFFIWPKELLNYMVLCTDRALETGASFIFGPKLCSGVELDSWF